MGAIKVKHFEGGRRLQGGGSAGSPDLASLLRDVADDLASIKTAVDAVVPADDISAAAPTAISADTPAALTAPLPTAVSAAALDPFTDPPSAAEMALLRTLVNELRTTVIETRTLVTDLAARVGEHTTLSTDLKARQAENLTLLTELKADVTAAVDAGSITLLTSKA